MILECAVLDAGRPACLAKAVVLPFPFMAIAREGYREIALSALVLSALGTGAWWIGSWPAAVPFVLVWLWVLSFFRDPIRHRRFARDELCAPADGTVTEVTELDHYDPFDGPAVRIGIFLSLLNVHINRSPCSGRVRRRTYERGQFLDARHPESGRRNESNTLLIDPDAPMPGPIVVRQVAGMLARRIICHVREQEQMHIGARFGMIKFGSRTELIIPRRSGIEIMVKPGDKVRAGLTVIARQAVD